MKPSPGTSKTPDLNSSMPVSIPSVVPEWVHWWVGQVMNMRCWTVNSGARPSGHQYSIAQQMPLQCLTDAPFPLTLGTFPLVGMLLSLLQALQETAGRGNQAALLQSALAVAAPWHTRQLGFSPKSNIIVLLRYREGSSLLHLYVLLEKVTSDASTPYKMPYWQGSTLTPNLCNE